MKRVFPIVQTHAIVNDECREFVIKVTGRPYYGFLVKHEDEIFAYANNCPHQGRMLQWMPNAFLTKDKTKIMCGAHGATFEIKTGLCDAGPCLGAHLKKLQLLIDRDVVFIEAVS